MSRIHEALKKAEQERASMTAAEVAPLLVDPSAAATARGGNVSGATAAVARPAAASPLSSGYLRFDDLRTHCAHPQWHLDPNANVFYSPDAHIHGAEQFRTLRSRIYQLRGAQPLRTLLVTSAIPAEGKTFLANNLAQAIVRQPDRRALVIDADLRLPRMHLALGAPLFPGLTDYLRGEADEISVIQHGQEGNLCFIPGGNEVSDPSELLSNGRFKTLLERVTPVFDWVIIDSPPCLPVADASILADLCDGVLIVVRAGSTPSETAQRACQEFRERNLIGVVLNRAEEPAGYGGESYHYGYAQAYAKIPQK
ncbi:MAG: CpsD/CapB family tyrosine-protein kinase [Candidatus Acidiferrales bacterium]